MRMLNYSDDERNITEAHGFEYARTDWLLRYSDSIQLTLVPTSNTFSEFKEFDWEISEFNTDGFEVQIYFENPEYISSLNSVNVDIIKVSFTNNHLYLRP